MKTIASVCIALTLTSTVWSPQQQAVALYSAESEYQIVTLEALTEDVSQDFFAGRSDNLILQCSEGSKLPFHFALQGSMLALEPECASCSLRLLQTCFIMFVNEEFFFSSDLHDWRNFQEYFTGTMSVNLDVINGEPTVGLSIELNPRP